MTQIQPARVQNPWTPRASRSQTWSPMPEAKGDVGRAADGGGFDTTDFALAVSCLATHEMTWLGRFSFGVSERERRVLLGVHLVVHLCQQRMNNVFCSVQRAPVSARPKELRQRSSRLAKSPQIFRNIHGGHILGHVRHQFGSLCARSRSLSCQDRAVQSLTCERFSARRK